MKSYCLTLTHNWFKTWIRRLNLPSNHHIRVGVKANNDHWFVKCAYTNYFRVGKFLTNSNIWSSSLPKFGLNQSCFSSGGLWPLSMTTSPCSQTATSCPSPWSLVPWLEGQPLRGVGQWLSLSWPWHLELNRQLPEIFQWCVSLAVSILFILHSTLNTQCLNDRFL